MSEPVRRGQEGGPRRQIPAVLVEHHDRLVEVTEHRIGGSLGGKFGEQVADLGRRLRAVGHAAEGVGEQLAAEADTEHRQTSGMGV